MILQQPFAISPSPSGFLYQSPISINSAQVPSTQTDFPVLVSQIDNRFKTVGNGGHVQNSSGFDIRPYSDSGITTAITGYELERYNASTGEVLMWVKVGSLSSSTTPIYLAYGNSTLTTDGSSTTTWSNSFLGVYHLVAVVGTTFPSATGSNNGTDHNNVQAVTGQIDGGGGFDSASSRYIDIGTGFNPIAITLSVWLKGTTFPGTHNSVIIQDGGAFNGFTLDVRSDGKLQCRALRSAGVTSEYNGTGSHTLSTGTWYYVVMTYSNAAGLVGYVDSASDKTVTGGFDLLNSGTRPTNIGRNPFSGTDFFNGVIDEPRIASVARSADWITTEYNNQFAPGTFETLGTEVAL